MDLLLFFAALFGVALPVLFFGALAKRYTGVHFGQPKEQADTGILPFVLYAFVWIGGPIGLMVGVIWLWIFLVSLQ